jgi:hypothetical protein
VGQVVHQDLLDLRVQQVVLVHQVHQVQVVVLPLVRIIH